jgi:hypothetical protein
MSTQNWSLFLLLKMCHSNTITHCNTLSLAAQALQAFNFLKYSHVVHIYHTNTIRAPQSPKCLRAGVSNFALMVCIPDLEICDLICHYSTLFWLYTPQISVFHFKIWVQYTQYRLVCFCLSKSLTHGPSSHLSSHRIQYNCDVQYSPKRRWLKVNTLSQSKRS